MNITLALLKEKNACQEALFTFVEKFGENGSPSAPEIFAALADLKRRDWLEWLIGKVEEFVPAVGGIDCGDWKACVAGSIEIMAGLALASGSATVEAYGSATVRAYDSATVRASDSATVLAYDYATVEAYGSATVRAYGSATIEAYDSATVRAYGSATVRAYDSAIVLLKSSLHVKLAIESDRACAVDRSGNRPTLILKE